MAKADNNDILLRDAKTRIGPLRLLAVRRIVAGTQAMTVYKPLKLIAGEAAKLAVDLAKGDKPSYNAKYDNGKKQVDTVLLQPTLLTKSNVDVVIKDGFYTQAQLAGN